MSTTATAPTIRVAGRVDAVHVGDRRPLRPRLPGGKPAGIGRRKLAILAAAWRFVSILAVLVVLEGGCSPTATEDTPSSPPVTTSAAPAAETTYSARHQATIEVEHGDGLVAAAGAVWVKTDDGRVVRIDPETNETTDEITVDTTSDSSRYCLGIGTDGESVWACATGDDGTGVAQIDPDTRQIVREVPVDKLFDQLAVPATPRGIWVLTGDGTNASVVEPGTGGVTAYPLGVPCQQLAAQADRAVATSVSSNTVIALDATSGAVAGQMSLPAPRVAALAGGDLWVDTSAGLTRLDRELVVRTVYQGLTAGPEGDLVAAAEWVLLRESDGTIIRIDPATGHIVERITPESPLTAGSLIVAFDSIWTTSSDDGAVVRLRLEP